MHDHSICICDSLGKEYKEIAYQVLHYLHFERIFFYGKHLETSQWNVYYLSRCLMFPYQTDSSSCGPFACIMAKAVVLNRKYVFTCDDYRRGSIARFTIANEFMLGRLI